MSGVRNYILYSIDNGGSKHKKTDFRNYLRSDISKKMISRTSGLNKSDYKPSTTKKRWISGIKIASNSRNKSTYLGDSQIEPAKKSIKASYKYRNLSFYNNQYIEKKKPANLLVPCMVSKYANNIISKPILLKKNIKNVKTLNGSEFDDSRTRNPDGIFNTNGSVSHQLVNESYLHMKSTDRKKLKRIKKKRSSTSNSRSKSKHTKSTTEYIAKPKEKSSSRQSSTFCKGPLYNTFYQKDKKVFLSILSI